MYNILSYICQGHRHTLEFCSGGVQQIQLRTERTGIWGAVAP